tara:strand:+ start:68 stop:535 length:468 start_codon:yes stop_codon:yes gene_type:complete
MEDLYTKEERQEAEFQLSESLTGNRWEDEYITDGVCPNCAGTGYQDAEDEIWDEDEQDYVEGNECDGWGQYGCDEGQMTGASWVDILQYDKKMADRKRSVESYDFDTAVNQVAAYVKYMPDPRLCYQQVQIDWPHLGRGERSKVISAGMKKAGLL